MNFIHALYSFKKPFNLLTLLGLTGLLSCQKSVSVPPPTYELVSSVVFTNDATATATLTGIDSEMMNKPNQFTNNYLTLYTGLAADELYYYTPNDKEEFYTN